MKLDTNTVIIGAGVAGMTAAIYLKRSNIDVIILEKSAPGGQITRTSTIDNYPGFISIDGPDLAMNMFNQVSALGVEYRYGNVQGITDYNDYKVIKTDTEEIKCKNIIVATGRRPRELGLEKEQQLIGKGISWCAICDGPLYKGKNVAVIGGGNSAVEEAQYLAGICKKVYLINRSNVLRADVSEQEKLSKYDNIEIMYNSSVSKINEENNRLSNITINSDNGLTILPIDGMFTYIGNEPNTEFLKSLPIKLEDDYVVVDQRMQTNIKGIYACGDVLKKDVYQISTALGEATIAALSIKKDN